MIIQKIYFDKIDSNFNSDSLINVLSSTATFYEYTQYMDSIQNLFTNEWSETSDKIVLTRTWVNKISYENYKLKLTDLKSDFKTVLSLTGINISETVKEI